MNEIFMKILTFIIYTHKIFLSCNLISLLFSEKQLNNLKSHSFNWLILILIGENIWRIVKNINFIKKTSINGAKENG